MPRYRVTYCPTVGGEPEVIEAERYEREAGGSLVFRRTVFVVGRPRDVVVRRLSASSVSAVEAVGA